MKSIYKPNFFNDETFNQIKENVFKQINDEDGMKYGEDCTRDYRVVFLSSGIKDLLLEKAKEETKDDSLEIIYTQVVRYHIQDGVAPKLKKHRDVANGEWVMDIVLDASVDWPLIIEHESFSNKPNSVIFIKGEKESHWRPDFPSTNEEDYVLLLFVHLANKDSHYAKMSREIFGMGEERAKSFLKSAVPAWGSFSKK